MLLFVNLVLGVISRVAQQMNIFSVGFPITLGVGLVGMLLTLPLMQGPFTMALERMLTNFQVAVKAVARSDRGHSSTIPGDRESD